ncbi:hypothetical protein P170DRAFT_52163 [Aspergillus steynii IBT 23096]|uniref:Uncharacterized protein n=1 Tax=Aspergillus steynii IBT 23096 TaxID=1392250 RepID=A0A2I2GSN6_9EURO|nr:uncharacterized protein P170DRAFT_52163 [Aspergillus steynii IBT 23096]PLB55888.1 hypothetical protein P170DRAFT_52163 [Aspergillus steynii IBT 23096]
MFDSKGSDSGHSALHLIRGKNNRRSAPLILNPTPSAEGKGGLKTHRRRTFHLIQSLLSGKPYGFNVAPPRHKPYCQSAEWGLGTETNEVLFYLIQQSSLSASMQNTLRMRALYRLATPLRNIQSHSIWCNTLLETGLNNLPAQVSVLDQSLLVM